MRLLDVPKDLPLEVDGLLADLDQAAGATAERHRPAVTAVGGPVGGNGRRRGEIPAAVEVVVDEVLQRGEVDVRLVVIAGIGPDMLNQAAEQPRPR